MQEIINFLKITDKGGRDRALLAYRLIFLAYGLLLLLLFIRNAVMLLQVPVLEVDHSRIPSGQQVALGCLDIWHRGEKLQAVIAADDHRFLRFVADHVLSRPAMIYRHVLCVDSTPPKVPEHLQPFGFRFQVVLAGTVPPQRA